MNPDKWRWTFSSAEKFFLSVAQPKPHLRQNKPAQPNPPRPHWLHRKPTIPQPLVVMASQARELSSPSAASAAILPFAFCREYATIAVPLLHSTRPTLSAEDLLVMKFVAPNLALHLLGIVPFLALAVLAWPCSAQTPLPLNLMPPPPTTNQT